MNNLEIKKKERQHYWFLFSSGKCVKFRSKAVRKYANILFAKTDNRPTSIWKVKELKAGKIEAVK